MITEDYPIEYTQHVLLGRNPDTEHGHWDTEHEAAWFFARSFEELLKGNEGKLLFIRRAPKLESHNLFDMDKPVYSMVGRFSIGKLKEKNNG
jgi:hypothetical protein